MRPILTFSALLVPVSLIHAQTAAVRMDEVVIASTPLGRTLFQQAQPVSVLEGRELTEAMLPSLGDTLSRLPGVASTGFAPGSSRPVIRGLGEDRIRILNNGVNLLDVSNLSPDHAVTLDPLLMDRVEVVRGPAALLYGPNGVGGVVNVLDGRIPETRVEPGLGGLPVRGKVDSRYASGSDLWSGAGQLDIGLGPVVIHLDRFRRATDDMRIPGEARSARLRKISPLAAGEKEASGRLPNSFTESEGGAVGASYVWDKGFFGASYSFLNSNYGTVADQSVTIDLSQERWTGRGAFYEPFAGVKQIKYNFGYSDYAHTEFEGPEMGTVFAIRGYDARVELEHEKLGPFEGAIGYQTNRSEFSAVGAEAFLPPSETDGHAVFLFEEIASGDLRWQFGLRYDRTAVASRTFADFGPGRNLSFDALSGSAGVVWQLPQDYSLALNASFTQRAPTYVELLANGPHLATAAFERGNPGLDLEQSLGLDLTLRKSSGFVTGSVSAFYNRFTDFVGLFPTGRSFLFEGHGGEEHGDEHGAEEHAAEEHHDEEPGHGPVELPEYAYEAVDAEFFGGEVELTFHLLAPAEAPVGQDGKQPLGKRSAPVTLSGTSGPQLDLELRADYVYTNLRGEGGSLPRIPPFRTSAALVLGYERITGRLEGQFSAAQTRTADFELPTDSFFLLNAGLSYRLLDGPATVDVFVRGTNLLNEEARLHTSFLKDIAPMEGRGVMVGLSAAF